MNALLRHGPTVVLASLALVGADAFAASTPAPTQVYQQRSADGRTVLTDHPSAIDVTERAWRIEPEDADAARQRGLDLKAEAQAVSERIQRGIDGRRLAEDDARRDRVARSEREAHDERDRHDELQRPRAIDLSPDDTALDGGSYFTPYLLQPAPRLHRQRMERRDDRAHRRPRPSAPPGLRGSAAPENR
ncbi:MAG: hypothetical protein ABI281_12490 [Caldimonas sp.]